LPEVDLPTAHLPNIAKIPDLLSTLMHVRSILKHYILAKIDDPKRITGEPEVILREGEL
jgi:hypothetical protein